MQIETGGGGGQIQTETVLRRSFSLSPPATFCHFESCVSVRWAYTWRVDLIVLCKCTLGVHLAGGHTFRVAMNGLIDPLHPSQNPTYSHIQVCVCDTPASQISETQ